MAPTPSAPAENSAEVEKARRDELFGNRKAQGRQSTMLTSYLDMAGERTTMRQTTGGR